MTFGSISKQDLFGSDWLFLIKRKELLVLCTSKQYCSVLGGEKKTSLVSSGSFAADELSLGFISHVQLVLRTWLVRECGSGRSTRR